MNERARPSFLLILQDELRYDLVHDADLCRTPSFDALRAQGTWFTRAYTPTGLCGPARASLLTGLYAHTHRVMNNPNGPDAISRNLSRDIPTLGELLRAEGYRTAYVGKWHVGVEDQAGSRGFDECHLGDGDPEWRSYAPLSDAWRALDPDVVWSPYPPASTERHPRRRFPLYVRDAIPAEMLPDSAIAQRSIDVLGELAAAPEPFLLVVSFRGPHWPQIVSEPYASMYDPASIPPWPSFHDDFRGKPRTNAAGVRHHGVDFTWEEWQPLLARYFGEVSEIDDLIGRIVGALDALPCAAETVLFASADHGDMAGSHRQFNKGPLMYEEVYHLPFVWRGPGVRTHHETAALASHLDVVPTCLDLAGAPPLERVHGRSLRSVLGGDEDGWRDALMSEYHGEEFGLYSQRMVRSGDHKLVYNPNDVTELYDLAGDPHELHNRADDPELADLRRELEVTLLDLMVETKDPLERFAVNMLG